MSVLQVLQPSRLSGRARLRRALTGHIELSSASVDDPEMQLGRFVSKGTLVSVILGFLCQENLKYILNNILDYFCNYDFIMILLVGSKE